MTIPEHGFVPSRVREFEWLWPAADALEDSHLHWHSASRAYHDPGEFRRHLDALVQSCRNVTFRLQSQKGAAPPGFVEAYEKWKEYISSDEKMVWANEARIEVTKRGGLQKQSRAVVRQIQGYEEAPEVMLQVSADVPTESIVKIAINRIPAEYRVHQAIEIARRWEVEDLPGTELLSALAYVFHVLDSLLNYMAELSVGAVGGSIDDYVRTVEFPPCLRVTPDMIPLAFAADTGEPYRLKESAGRVPDDPISSRYPTRRPSFSGGGGIDALARQVHDGSRTNFKKGGVVLPIAFLRGQSGEWKNVFMMAEDKRDKYMMWRDIGREVLTYGYDAVIFSSESWYAEAAEVERPYLEVEGLPGRQEFVTTYYETMSGSVGMLSSKIKRPLGIRTLGKVHAEPLAGDVQHAGFMSPVRRSWRALSAMEE